VFHFMRLVRVATVVAATISTGRALGAPGEPPSGASPSCEDLADRIALSHPALRAARFRAAAAAQRSHAESSLPPPTASFEIWDFPIGAPSRADREGMYMFGLGQEFPGGGRTERSRAEQEMAREARAEGDDLGRRLRAESAHACVAWSVAEAVRARLVDHRRLIEQVRDAALVSYRGSAGGLGAVARADAELAAAERRIAETEAESETARATLAALADDDVKLPGTAPELPPGERDASDRAVNASGGTTRGDVSAARARQAAAAARLEAASSEASTPSFEVRATYMQTPGERPGLGAMLGMSLPWLWGGGGERETGARHELEAASADADAVRRAARVEVAQASGRVRALRRSLAVLRERELPAAERAVAAERASLGSGGFDLAAWLQSANALRVARVDEARMQGEIEHAVVDFAASVGRPLAAPRREESRR
jgi:outer membrane protein TolC